MKVKVSVAKIIELEVEEEVFEKLREDINDLCVVPEKEDLLKAMAIIEEKTGYKVYDDDNQNEYIYCCETDYGDLIFEL